MDDFTDISINDISDYVEKNNLPPEEHASLVKKRHEFFLDNIEKKYSGVPDGLINATNALEEDTKKGLSYAASRRLAQKAFDLSEGDQESATEMLKSFSKKHGMIDERKANHLDYGDIQLEPEENDIGMALDDPIFHLNDITSLKPDYINGPTGSPVAKVIDRKTKDGGMEAFVKYIKNSGDSIEESPTSVIKYKPADDNDVEQYTSKLRSEVEAGIPEAMNLDPASNVRKTVEHSFNRSKEGQKINAKIKELRLIDNLSPEAKRAYVTRLNRNETISKDPNAFIYLNNLSPDSDGKGLSQESAMNLLAEDAFKGLMRFEGSMANAADELLGSPKMKDGSSIEQENLNTLSGDTSMGMTSFGLEGNSKKVISGISGGMQSLGNMAIPLIGSFVSGGLLPTSVVGSTNAGMNASMALSAIGSKLNEIDNKLEEKKSALQSAIKSNPLSDEVTVLQNEIDILTKGRRSSAITNGIIEGSVEAFGGVGGSLTSKILPNIGRTGKAIETIVSEYAEEVITDPLQVAADQVIFNDALAPDHQDALELLVSTMSATLPLAALGVAGNSDTQDQKQNLLPSGNITPQQAEVIRAEYERIHGAISTFQAQKPEIDQKAKEASDKIASNESERSVPTEAITATVESASEPFIDKNKTKDSSQLNENTDISHLTPEDRVLFDNGDDDTKNKVLSDYVSIPTFSEGSTQNTEGNKPSGASTNELKVKKPVIDYAVSTFASVKDFGEWSKMMINKFGNWVSDSLKSIWDHVLSSYKSAYNIAIDSSRALKQNLRGIKTNFEDAKDYRLFNEAVDINTATPEKIEYIKNKFPGLFNESIRDIVGKYQQSGNIDGLIVSDLAKLFAFREKGFEKGVTIVDEGSYTAKLEGDRPATGAFVTPNNNQAKFNDGSIKAPELTENEQRLLRSLYGMKIVSEDSLPKLLKSIFRTKAFLSLYARTPSSKVENLNNAADATITDKEKRQSKIKEVESVNAVIDPANPVSKGDSIISKSFIHQKGNKFDVLNFLGIERTPAFNDDGTHYGDFISKKGMKKLAAYYDSIFGKDNWILKEAAGAAGSGFYSSSQFRGQQYVNDAVIQRKLDIAAEYRVNVYLDKSGKARAVPGGLSEKKANSESGRTPHYTPYTTETAFTREIQAFAEKALTESSRSSKNKSTGKGAIYGVDVAILNNEDGSSPFESKQRNPYVVIEFNSPDPYVDENDWGGVTGTFSRHKGFPMANFAAFLQGQASPELSLSNIIVHMVKSGKMSISQNDIVANQQNSQLNENKGSSGVNPDKNDTTFYSGIDPTQLIPHLKTLYGAVKDLASFIASSVKTFGEWIKPIASQIFDELVAKAGEITSDFLESLGVGPMNVVSLTKQQAAMLKANKVELSNQKSPVSSRSNYIKFNGINFDKNYLSKATVNTLNKLEKARKLSETKAGLMSLSEIDSVAYQARKEENQNKFNELKKNNKEAFVGYTWNGDLRAARNRLIEYLDEEGITEPVDAKKERKMTKKRAEAISHLNENKRLFDEEYTISPEFIALDSNVKSYVVAAYTEILKLNDETSTNNIRRAAAALASLIDNGSPIGMKKYAVEWTVNKWVDAANKLKDNLVSDNQDLAARLEIKNQSGRELVLGDYLSNPISNFRRLNLSNEQAGYSIAQAAVELEKMSAGKGDILTFLHNLVGFYIGGLDSQSVELNNNRAEWTNFLAATFPQGIMLTTATGMKSRITPTQSTRVGVASILTQYEKNSLNPLDELKKAFNDLNLSIEYRSQIDNQKDQATIDRAAFNDLLRNVDYGAMTHTQVIAEIESQLSNEEIETLQKIREMGDRYINDLRIVAGISSNKSLTEYENYVKLTSVGQDDPAASEGGAKAFDSDESILNERKGIARDKNNPNRASAYYITDIMQVADKMFREATYEKHTGIQRSLLRSLLNDGRFTDLIEDQNHLTERPRVTRIKQLLGNYHRMRTGTGAFMEGAVVNIAYSAIGIGKGFAITSASAFFSNIFSAIPNAIVAYASTNGPMLLSISKDRAISRTRAKAMNTWLKENFPSQAERMSKIDDSRPAQRVNSKFARKAQIEMEAGKGQLVSVLRNSLGVTSDIAIHITEAVISVAAHASAASAEAYLATNSFWASYLSKLNDKGYNYTSIDDFLARPVKDQEAGVDAMLIVDRITGVASLRESNGGFYHLDTAGKIILNNTLLEFIRQSSQMTLQAGNELAHLLDSRGTPKEKIIHATRFAAILASMILYTGTRRIIQGFAIGAIGVPLLYSALTGAGDDEDKKEAVRKEIMRRKKTLDKRASFSMKTDLLSLFTGQPVFQSKFAKGALSRAWDYTVTDSDDEFADIAVEQMRSDIEVKSSSLRTLLKTGRIGEASATADEISTLEKSIEDIKYSKGVYMAPRGTERVRDDEQGSFSVLYGAVDSLVDLLEKSGAEDLAKESIEKQLDTSPLWFKLSDLALKTGIQNAVNKTNKKVAEDRYQTQVKEEKDFQKGMRKALNATGR